MWPWSLTGMREKQHYFWTARSLLPTPMQVLKILSAPPVLGGSADN